MRIEGVFEPKINLIQRTTPTAAWSSTDEWGNQEMHGWGRIVELYREGGGYDDIRDMFPESSADTFEGAGRVCYKAWGRKNAKTASNEGYIHNILRQNHWSVLEHASYTFLIENIPRSATHELVRHRHFSFSQESQRYVKQDPEVGRVALSPTLASELDDTEIDLIGRGVEHPLTKPYQAGFTAYHEIYERLRRSGKTHKEAAGAARDCLPESAVTSIIVTGNPRSWAEFITKRASPAAEASIRAIAVQIADLLEEELPEVFGWKGREIWDINNEQKGTQK